MKKKILIVLLIIVLIFGLVFGGLVLYKLTKKSSKEDDVYDRTQAQQKMHLMLMRNTTWGDSLDTVANEEKDNILDYGKKYITIDYENVFDYSFLPTYIFSDDKLVAVLYEMKLSDNDLSSISNTHQLISSDIHSIYEQLYRENNYWKSGQDRIYDVNMWSQAITNGELQLNSIWNSTDEKIFLITSKNSSFNFLDNIQSTKVNGSLSFVLVSNDYLEKHDIQDLMKIKPNKTLNSNYNYSENATSHSSASGNSEKKVGEDAEKIETSIVEGN